MTRPEHPLQRFTRETAARPAAVGRVLARLGTEDVSALRAALRALPGATPVGTARVIASLRTRPRARVAPLLATAFVTTAFACAAAALLALRFLYAPPLPLGAGLDAAESWAALQPTDEVRFDFRGRGRLGGTSRAPVVDWEVGVLRIEVEPERGIDLVVHTREADVRVVGTGFTVSRDALGTTVAVTHGHVAVMCVDGEKQLLGAAEQRICLPTNASGLLGRAQALVDQGATGDEVLAAADHGLAAGASGAVRGELELLRVETLTRLGRAAEALGAADAALAGAPSRRIELQRLAARNALDLRGCTGALPYLAALAATDTTGPELVQYADCVEATEPAAARDALMRALRAGAPPDQESGIVARLARLAAAGTR